MRDYFLLFLVLVLNVSRPLNAKPIVVDTFVTSAIDIVANAASEQFILEIQNNVAAVPGDRRYLYLGSFKSTSPDDNAFVRISDGALAVQSPFPNEVFLLGYGRVAAVNGDLNLSLASNDTLVVHFDYFRAQQPHEYSLGFGPLAESISASTQGIIQPSDMPFSLVVPLSTLDATGGDLDDILADVAGFGFNLLAPATLDFAISEITIVPEPLLFVPMLAALCGLYCLDRNRRRTR
jgi:hypothetical protein